ncbi:MAG: mechanosensitive ion channel [Bacteroidales bacterium]|nr:mechanosensitive ion channel [Bacteroidales bacterium]
MENLQVYLDKAVELVIAYAPKFLLAIIVLLVGLRVIKIVNKFTKKRFEKSKVDPTVQPFAISLIDWTFKAVLFISVASMVGVETTSFVAVLGAAGLAIGLALQGTLSNFAGGVLILLFKPYKVGDFVQVKGQMGTVTEVQIFNTILASMENNKIIVANGSVFSDEITNYSALGSRRVDLVVGISYSSNIKQAKEILLNIMNQHSKVLKEPTPPFVGVLELADSSVNLAVRPFCEPDDYWDVYFDILEQSKIALDKHGVTIPFPQLNVHFDKNTTVN